MSATSFLEEDLKGRTVVMIDVLRASSTIVAALHNGARDVIPVPGMAEAIEASKSMDRSSYLLGGEENGVKIEECDFGNSPLEYTSDVVGGKTIILNTTNGTKALNRCAMAREVAVGCFLNLSRLVEFLEHKESIALVCAGWRGRMSLEDLLCAGNIIYELTGGTLSDCIRDGAKTALGLYEKFGSDIEGTIQQSNHAVRLRGIVGSEDITFCCNLSTMHVLPLMNEGIISDTHG